jgi:glycosyltransferase involved in cell wall biosynthesis
MNVTLLIPTLNELVGLKAIMPRVDTALFSQILVVDGGSTDGTVEYSKALGYDVVSQTSHGVRAAYQDAWPSVTGDVVLTFSPDGNCIPEDLPRLVEKIRDGYDMVIASRYYQGATSDDDDWLTGFGNWLFTKIINVFFGGRYTDAMTIYRIYRKDLVYDLQLFDLKSYQLEPFFGCSGGYEPLMSIRAARMGLKTADIGSPEPARIGGERKLRPFRWGMFYLSQIFLERVNGLGFRPRGLAEKKPELELAQNAEK